MTSDNFYLDHLEVEGSDQPDVEFSLDGMEQLREWLEEAVKKEEHATTMALATSTFEGKPTVRMMFLRRLDERGLLFFTNFESKKGKQLLQNPYASACFYWPQLGREVRVEGYVSHAPESDSDAFFAKQEEPSQLCLWALPQSQVVQSRKYLETLCSDFREEFAGKKITRPTNWGGYVLEPQLIDFLQLRPNGIHDRVQYTLFNGEWQQDRLAP